MLMPNEKLAQHLSWAADCDTRASAQERKGKERDRERERKREVDAPGKSRESQILPSDRGATSG